jgi:hypothetical protein
MMVRMIVTIVGLLWFGCGGDKPLALDRVGDWSSALVSPVATNDPSIPAEVWGLKPAACEQRNFDGPAKLMLVLCTMSSDAVAFEAMQKLPPTASKAEIRGHQKRYWFVVRLDPEQAGQGARFVSALRGKLGA